MLSVTIPSISPSQKTPVLPNMRRIVTRPSGTSCSRRNSAKLSLATILYPPFWPSGLGSRRILIEAWAEGFFLVRSRSLALDRQILVGRGVGEAGDAAETGF